MRFNLCIIIAIIAFVAVAHSQTESNETIVVNTEERLTLVTGAGIETETEPNSGFGLNGNILAAGISFAIAHLIRRI